MTSFFFFNDTATTEIYTLSLHDALPIFHVTNDRKSRKRNYAHEEFHEKSESAVYSIASGSRIRGGPATAASAGTATRSEEHTSELQSRLHLVCRLLLEKKKRKKHLASIADATSYSH